MCDLYSRSLASDFRGFQKNCGLKGKRETTLIYFTYDYINLMWSFMFSVALGCEIRLDFFYFGDWDYDGIEFEFLGTF
jgi:hypothetical protein